MNSNKFRNIIIYAVVIAALLFSFVSVIQYVLNTQGPEPQTDEIERDWKKISDMPVATYSSVLNDFDSYIVEEYYLDLGSGYLYYFKQDEPNTR